VPLMVDMDTQECFLETGESVGHGLLGDNHHMLDCECDKVKCNCVKHCECTLPTGGGGGGGGGGGQDENMLLQHAEGSSNDGNNNKARADNALLQMSEGTDRVVPVSDGDDVDKSVMPPAEVDDDNVPDDPSGDSSTEDFLKHAGVPGNTVPNDAKKAPVPRGRGLGKAMKKDEYSYEYSEKSNSDNANEHQQSDYSYSYSDSGSY